MVKAKPCKVMPALWSRWWHDSDGSLVDFLPSLQVHQLVPARAAGLTSTILAIYR